MERFAFWLEPASDEKTFLASLVRDLARRFDAPIFEPHLTLCGGALWDEQDALQVVRKLALRSTYELELDCIDVSERFTKTLFLRFRCSDKVNQLRQAIGETLHLPTESEFDPHLSLLYKEMEMAEKKELAGTITIPFQRISFAGLTLIAHPVEITTRADVEAWRTLARRSLPESSR